LLISIFTKLALDIDLFIDVAIGGWVKLAESTVEESEMSQLTSNTSTTLIACSGLFKTVVKYRSEASARWKEE
jgi:hypothetical protein